MKQMDTDNFRRPDLPKRLAAKIRAAHRRVVSARECIEHYQERIRQHSARQAEYDGDPVRFAQVHYAGHGVDSYPVQTTIARNSEALSYYSSHLPEKIVALATADGELNRTEIAVLDEVKQIRGTSQGRIPWPTPLVSIESFRLQALDERAAQHDELILRGAERTAEDAAFEKRNAQLMAPETLLCTGESNTFARTLRVDKQYLHFAIAPGRAIQLGFADGHCSKVCGDDIEQGGGFARFNKWDLFKRLCCYGVTWRGFEAWLLNYQLRYQTAVGDIVGYRNKIFRTLKDKTSAYKARHEICRTITGFFPPDVFPMNLAETTHTWPGMLRQRLSPLLHESAFIFYARFSWFQLTTLSGLLNLLKNLTNRDLLIDDGRGRERFSPNAIIRELTAARLLVCGHSVPPSLVMSALNNNQLVALLRACSIEPFRTKAENYAASSELMSAHPDSTIDALHSAQYSAGLAAFLPPESMAWQDLQDCRQICIAMATTLQELDYAPERFKGTELNLFCGNL
jgi:hypothetical protein